MDRIAVVLGTRPEMIKLAPVLDRLGHGRVDVIRTGQHFSMTMTERVESSLGLPREGAQLRVGAGRRGAQLSRIVGALDARFAACRPAAVLVQGDTTSALAGALAANAAEIPLVHVEAGLRSFDRRMPEEHNRVLIDHLADLCCAPTETNRTNLLAERVPGNRIAVTGNPVVEAVLATVPPEDDRASMRELLGLRPAGFVLATLHRPENVDDPVALDRVLRLLGTLPVPVVLPLHPRTADRVAKFGLTRRLAGLVTTEPLGYPEFLALAAESALIVTDSGGLQEEASVLKRPVVVVRRSTERPEIEGTFSVLVRPEDDLASTIESWLATAAGQRDRLAAVPSPYGDGHAAQRIAEEVNRLLVPHGGVAVEDEWPLAVEELG